MDARHGLVGLIGTAVCAVAVAADDAWRFELTPYVWVAGLEGKVGTIPGQPPVDIDISSSDALDDTDLSLMILLDAKKGRHGFLVDALYTDVRSDFELLPDPINLRMRSISKTTILSSAYQYELYGQNAAAIDAFAGVRYWDLDTTLEFSGGLGVLAGQKISNTESWFDPFVGLKAARPIGQSRFYVRGGAAVGGFGAGSDLFYDLNATIGYQWSPAIGTAIGYRLFDVDYDESDFVYDVTQQGWGLALTWGF
jgi:hypothetical protein